jgi:hypothetical protein
MGKRCKNSRKEKVKNEEQTKSPYDSNFFLTDALSNSQNASEAIQRALSDLRSEAYELFL